MVKLDVMYYEGSISRFEERLRIRLFKALLDVNEDIIEEILQDLKPLSESRREGNKPFLHRAKRIVEAENPC